MCTAVPASRRTLPPTLMPETAWGSYRWFAIDLIRKGRETDEDEKNTCLGGLPAGSRAVECRWGAKADQMAAPAGGKEIN